MNNEYGVNQITSLEGLTSIRMKPAMYVGSTSQEGINQIVFEVWDNSFDEYGAGFGNEVNVTIDKDNYITIEDFGRGIPVGPHPTWKKQDGTPLNTLTGVLTKLHAGGKLFADGSTGYLNSIGTYGIGSKATNALSDDFIVTVKREGKMYQQKFKKGEPISEVEEIGKTKITGTTIKFHPDPSIFKSTIIPNDKKLQNRLDEITSLNVNLKVNYKNELSNIEHTFYYPNGIADYIKNKLTLNKKLLFDIPLHYKSEYKNDNETMKVEFSFLYMDEVESNDIIKTFANNVSTKEHGTHLQGFKEGFKDAINEYGISKKIIQEPVEIKYLMDNICLIVSVSLNECELDGQTKSKLGNVIAKEGVAFIVKEFFNNLSKEQKNIISTIIERANNVKQAEEAARRARINSRKANKINKIALPGKLADCANNKGYSELFLVEGNSASGSAKNARYREFQAILPLRGKILNVEKVGFDKVINSDTIKSLIASIGTGIGKNFNIDKCRYDKIIMMCDADVDGYHITNLLLTFIYNYMRPLIEKGFIYSTMPPLYKVTDKKSSLYLKDDFELKEYKKKHKGDIDVQRFKGLGEMDSHELKETTMDPETRLLKRITIDNVEEMINAFNICMGSDVKIRRQFIEENASKAEY